jgi:hypothetical protein
MLALFLRKKLIDQTRVKMLKDWKHSGFSIESETRLFSKEDREALGQYIKSTLTRLPTRLFGPHPQRIQQGQDRDLQGI